ncbi:MAG: CDP-diacylglycerol--serine O-phosphatidyltransferase [Pseudomonadota bacterium]|jgi:CDP-diacylglycerol--serine O-phosphatidyltransferase
MKKFRVINNQKYKNDYQGENEYSRHKAIYLLPNAFTTAALFCGFYAIIQAMNGMFDKAVTSIFMAMVLDGLDGRVARMTRTQSPFGEQFDSLSDMVSFGVAPAILAYEFGLKHLGKWGWLIAFIYCAGAALRLARFNTNIGIINKSFFQGIPSPAAAANVAGFMWLVMDKPQVLHFLHSYGINHIWILCGITLYIGLAMVSNIPFYSGKTIGFGDRVPFSVVVLFLIIFAAVAVEPAVLLFVLFFGYALSGFCVLIYYKLSGKGNPVKKVS